jgi:hypothetical protein
MASCANVSYRQCLLACCGVSAMESWRLLGYVQVHQFTLWLQQMAAICMH